MKKTPCKGGKRTVRIQTARGVVTFKACKIRRRKRPVTQYAACVGERIAAAGRTARAQGPLFRPDLRWGRSQLKRAAKACAGRTGVAQPGPQGNAAMELLWLGGV